MKDNKISNIYSDKIYSSVNEINDFFDYIIKLIECNKDWSKQSSIELEIKKSFIRGILRHSNLTDNLINNLIYEFKKLNSLNSCCWITRPYPMIHLPKDISEGENKLHYDQEGNLKMFTCWLPITNYEYNGLNIFNFENLFTQKLSKILVRMNSANKVTYNPEIKKGNFFIWSGRRLHKGNVNTSTKVSCAFQLKITQEPYLTEPNFNFQENKINLNLGKEINYLELFKKYKEIIQIIDDYCLSIKSIEEISLEKIVEITKNKIDRIDKILSFSLSTLSQRLRSLTNRNITKFNKTNCHVYDAVSMLIGSDNLICVKRVLNDNNKLYEKFNDKYYFNNLDFLKTNISNSRQWNILIKSKKINLSDYPVYKF